MATTQKQRLLEAKLGKEVHIVEYRVWNGIKGFIQWESTARTDKFESETILKVNCSDFPKLVIVNGKEYTLSPKS